jgi:hypothetical protein
MTCPYCESTDTAERTGRTELGYRRFRCRVCVREFNERTGTLFNRLQYPTDVVCLVVLWRFRYKLSLRDLTEMFLQRGLAFTSAWTVTGVTPDRITTMPGCRSSPSTSGGGKKSAFTASCAYPAPRSMPGSGASRLNTSPA